MWHLSSPETLKPKCLNIQSAGVILIRFDSFGNGWPQELGPTIQYFQQVPLVAQTHLQPLGGGPFVCYVSFPHRVKIQLKHK